MLGIVARVLTRTEVIAQQSCRSAFEFHIEQKRDNQTTRSPFSRMDDCRDALAKLDRIGWYRSYHQRIFHEDFLQACARIFWKTMPPGQFARDHHSILVKNSWEHLAQEILISTPRRFGKTISVSMFAAALMVSCPRVEVSIYSTCKRISQKLLRNIQKFIYLICDQDIASYHLSVVRQNMEEVVMKGPESDEDVRIINSYPSKVGLCKSPPFDAMLDLYVLNCYVVYNNKITCVMDTFDRSVLQSFDIVDSDANVGDIENTIDEIVDDGFDNNVDFVGILDQVLRGPQYKLVELQCRNSGIASVLALNRLYAQRRDTLNIFFELFRRDRTDSQIQECLRRNEVLEKKYMDSWPQLKLITLNNLQKVPDHIWSGCSNSQLVAGFIGKVKEKSAFAEMFWHAVGLFNDAMTTVVECGWSAGEISYNDAVEFFNLEPQYIITDGVRKQILSEIAAAQGCRRRQIKAARQKQKRDEPSDAVSPALETAPRALEHRDIMTLLRGRETNPSAFRKHRSPYHVDVP